ncbi:nicotinate phosphoribosyltransferase [Streptomyces phyllanthi]|uniref:Nicotinate phosphoribosyltransferase n=1 Tax=Streptomyces phyllanthi TaxID=1803180 RepID=A0A5N8VZN5_9ACTN|nr:nicotinate phosphoribosyltransferase [Streptomyces phyllanthi]MPY40166.1 nicotinate phosphoribosyltransferase [Streptomyces phyllanthi]
MSDATTTDLYEVTMAMSYLREGMTGPATFSLFVRDLPPERGFLVAAGLESALDYLSGLHVGSEDVDAFASALNRPRQELQPLFGLEFTGDVRAVPEGRIVLAGEPLLEVTAPLPQAQLAETYVLNQLSHQTAIASKAARCVLAAAGHPVVDFSLRRTHGPQAGHQAARLSAMVGFAGTSNVAAATAEGVPAVGTMAHSFVEAFPTEEEAFRAFARAHPGPVTFLVDTYDTEAGVHIAARVLRDLEHAARGPGSAVRLDSGDLGALAVRARAILDAAGLPDVGIVASGGLDEYAVDELVRSGAPIDTYAVGTRVGVSADAPYLDSAYKMVEYDGRPVMKLSSAKVTAPGSKQVFRRTGYADVTGLAGEQPPDGGRPLLETVMRHGRRTSARPPLDECRERFAADLAGLPPAARLIRAPVPPRAKASERLTALTNRVRHRIEEETHAPAARPRSPERSTSGSHRSAG